MSRTQKWKLLPTESRRVVEDGGRISHFILCEQYAENK